MEDKVEANVYAQVVSFTGHEVFSGVKLMDSQVTQHIIKRENGSVKFRVSYLTLLLNFIPYMKLPSLLLGIPIKTWGRIVSYCCGGDQNTHLQVNHNQHTPASLSHIGSFSLSPCFPPETQDQWRSTIWTQENLSGQTKPQHKYSIPM